MADTRSNMVAELAEYLRQKGRTLLIKGLPGSGKTTLALHLLGSVGGGAGVYFSSRVSDESMRRHFEAIEKVIPRENFIDTRLGLAETFLEQVFSAIRKKPPIVVLDSWDAYAKKMGETERLKTEEVLITLATSSESSLVFVGESVEPGNLDFLVDAVVEMRTTELDGRIIREMVTHKLRGRPIWRSHELISLHQAKINTLQVYVKPDFSKSKLTPTEDNPEIFPLTGELGRLFTGMRRGSIFLIELSMDAPFELAESMAMGCVLNQLAHDRRAIIVPPNGVDPLLFLRKYEGVLPWHIIAQRTRVVVLQELEADMALGGRTTSQENPVKQLSSADAKEFANGIFRVWGGAKKRSKDGGVIGLVDIGQFETTFANRLKELTEFMAMAISRASLLRDCVIFVARENSVLKNILQSVSDTHIKITTKHGVGLMFGVKPHTVIYGIDPTRNPIEPEITPIL